MKPVTILNKYPPNSIQKVHHGLESLNGGHLRAGCVLIDLLDSCDEPVGQVLKVFALSDFQRGAERFLDHERASVHGCET